MIRDVGNEAYLTYFNMTSYWWRYK
jgi:hypothetical protein